MEYGADGESTMGRPRKLPDGMEQRGKTYYAQFRARNGKRVHKKLSNDFKIASELLRAERARADREDYGIFDNDYSLEALRKEYLAQCNQSLRPRTVKRYKHSLDTILDGLAVLKVKQLTVERILAYREKQLASVKNTNAKKKERTLSPRTINIDLACLSQMLNWGVKHSKIGSNPLANIEPLPTDQKAKERRAMSGDEVLAVLKAAPGHLMPVLRMFATTGMRRDEIVELKFSDVDFGRQCVNVIEETAKNHQAREIPIDDEMLEIIKQLKSKASQRQPVPGHTAKQTSQQAANLSREHVFVNKANCPWRNNLLREFYRVCRKAKIEGAGYGGSVDLHSMRGTFATLAIEGGANPRSVQAVLGHSSLELTMNVYSKASEKAKRDAVAALPFAKFGGADVSKSPVTKMSPSSNKRNKTPKNK